MRVIVNGVARESAGATVGQLWEEERREREIDSPRGFAIALNGAIVRRERWNEARLEDGDRIEIVRAFSGG